MVGNGTISYDHDRDGRPTELGGCNAMVRNLRHDSFIFIRYVRRRLTVSLRLSFVMNVSQSHTYRKS